MEQSEFERTKIGRKLLDYINRSHLEESSVEILNRSLKWFVELHGDIEPAETDYGRIDDFRSWLKKGRAGSSANTYLAMAKGFYSWLFKRGHIGTDPFEGVKRYGTAEKQFDIYEPDEIRRILQVADLRWQTIVCLALCSMRRAEILNLCVKDIDFERNEIRIRPKEKSATTWPWSIKNHNEALVGIDDTIAQLLMRQIEELEDPQQPYVVLKKFYWQRNLRLQEAGDLTHRLRNNPWGNFNRDFKDLLTRAGVPHKRPHDLRGTFATERYRDGYTLVDLQILMRHASIQTTARYVKKIDGRKLLKLSGRTFKKHYATYVP